MTMDYHNNAVGREIGSQTRFTKSGTTVRMVVDDIMAAFKNKRLFWCCPPQSVS
jgi:hypothetical protein